MQKVTIMGEFHSLNEYVDANRVRRGSWSKGNAMKQADQKEIVRQLPRIRFEKPLILHYCFYCKNRKRDLDNISGYFHKIFQDALVVAKVIPDDGWRYVRGMSDNFWIDAHNPRIVVYFEELEDGRDNSLQGG